jgi:protoporphyrinogen oxidase
LRFGEFLVDTGAHRLHDRDSGTTAIAHDLLGEDLLHVDVPSQLYHRGRLLDFPLAPLNLIRSLPARTLGAIAMENLRLHLTGSPEPAESFGAFARSTYGETLARIALLDYSRKLWGCDPDDLLPEVAGVRLSRLDLTTFLLESIAGRGKARRHLDGAFLYPRFGIGQLFDRAAERLGGSVHTRSAVSRLRHEGERVTAVDIQGNGTVEAEHVVNTLPLGVTATLLDPAPPPEILAAAAAIRFRQLRLCILLLERERFTPNASIYFPGAAFPFTRLYESKNRSPEMAPAGATALVLEVPCDWSDMLAKLDAQAFNAYVVTSLSCALPIRRREIIGMHSVMVPNAYPVLERATAPAVALLREYFARFENMQMVGRNASFRYTSIHDMFRGAARAVRNFADHASA